MTPKRCLCGPKECIIHDSHHKLREEYFCANDTEQVPIEPTVSNTKPVAEVVTGETSDEDVHSEIMSHGLRQLEWDHGGQFADPNRVVDRHNREIVTAFEMGLAAGDYSNGFTDGREAGYHHCGSCSHAWEAHDGECRAYMADGSICGCKKIITVAGETTEMEKMENHQFGDKHKMIAGETTDSSAAPTVMHQNPNRDPNFIAWAKQYWPNEYPSYSAYRSAHAYQSETAAPKPPFPQEFPSEEECVNLALLQTMREERRVNTEPLEFANGCAIEWILSQWNAARKAPAIEMEMKECLVMSQNLLEEINRVLSKATREVK